MQNAPIINVATIEIANNGAIGYMDYDGNRGTKQKSDDEKNRN